MRTAVIVPTIRPEQMLAFADAWESQFNCENVRLIVVEDHDLPTFDMPTWADHYCHQSIDAYLGDKAGCIARNSGAIRSFGFWLAGQDKSIDMIVSLDDDVRPTEDFSLAWHWEALQEKQHPRWWHTAPFHVRGEPYHLDEAQVVFNHGLWSGVPDLDAQAQLNMPGYRWEPTTELRSVLIPPGMYTSLCSMNVAFRREIAEFYFCPGWPDGMKRWEDIWTGLILKRLADLHGWAITSGWPVVMHERASNPLANLRQEMLGYGINERMWQVIDGVGEGATPQISYQKIINAIGRAFPELDATIEAMHCWAQLW